MRGIAGRLAGAPISWGVSEVADWGHQMPPGRVLDEMRAAGLAATELGPPGYLPAAPGELRTLLTGAGLEPVGAFLATVLHRPLKRARALELVCDVAATLSELGAGMLVLGAAAEREGYELKETLDRAGWDALAETLSAAGDEVAGRGVEIVLHPHIGTVVEGAEDVARLLDVSEIGLCLDTGHLAAAGADPLDVATGAAGRIRHVHLKDVDGALTARMRSGEIGFAEAVRRGMFRPLGDGDAGVAAIVRTLEASGYRGWYVMEQDTALSREPGPGEGPVRDVRRSVEFMTELAAASEESV